MVFRNCTYFDATRCVFVFWDLLEGLVDVDRKLKDLFDSPFNNFAGLVQ